MIVDSFLKDPHLLIDVFESMRDGLMVVDPEGRIVFFNQAAERITGYSKEEVMGKECSVLDSDTCVIMTESGKFQSCDLFKKGVIDHKKCRIKAQNGRAVYLLKNAVTLKDDTGKIIGAVETMTDITSLYMKEKELEEIKQELRQEYWFMGLLGKSLPMQKIYEQVRNAAGSEAPVMVLGESGTGKNLVAKAIHALSRRKEGPFVSMNCASLNEHLLESELFGHKKGSFTGAISDRIGRFEAAHNGTIFLDEIGDMPVIMQAKLLRVLEEKVVERVGEHKPVPVNVRLVSATNRDLGSLVSQGRFREDLLYRVNSIVIEMPPLRKRIEDIPLLAFHYLKKISVVNNKDIRGISSDAMEVLEHYSWPGNVRQLINLLEHSAISCRGDTLEVSDLPKYVFHHEQSAEPGNGGEREKIRTTLALCKGNKTLAAKHLGISRVTLWKKIKELGISSTEKEEVR